MKVGGSGKCNTGTIALVNIGGSFKSEGAVDIEEIDVGGSTVVGPGSKVGTVDVGGSFKSLGDVTFGDIDVGGAVKFAGTATGESIDVGGSLKVDGDLNLSEDLDVGGKVSVEGNIKCEKKIKVGGVITATGRIESFRIIVGGRIEADYIKAHNGFRVGRRSEVIGFVESEEILVRERGRTETLYGDNIRIEDRARIKNIYGREIYLEREVVVEGEVLYTESIEMEDGVKIGKGPDKVDKLPPPEDLN